MGLIPRLGPSWVRPWVWTTKLCFGQSTQKVRQVGFGGWLVGWLAGWLAGWLVGWSVGRSVGYLIAFSGK